MSIESNDQRRLSIDISHKLDEQSLKKTIHHKTVVFLGHMNDNSNFTFPITSTIPEGADHSLKCIESKIFYYKNFSK